MNKIQFIRVGITAACLLVSVCVLSGLTAFFIRRSRHRHRDKQLFLPAGSACQPLTHLSSTPDRTRCKFPLICSGNADQEQGQPLPYS